MTTNNDALVAKALELAEWPRTVRALVMRLRAAEKVCEKCECFATFKEVKAWRAIRDESKP